MGEEEGGGVTLIYFHISKRLPPVHGDNPLVSTPAAGEVNDELGCVSAEGIDDGLEAFHGEFCVREEVGREDDLSVSHKPCPHILQLHCIIL